MAQPFRYQEASCSERGAELGGGSSSRDGGIRIRGPKKRVSEEKKAF